jgi:PTS system mannose-specific IIA component
MNAVLVVAHAPLAAALRLGVVHVFPDAATWIQAVDVMPEVSLEDSLSQARVSMASLAALPNVAGVLVVTDLFGATPCNLAQKLVDGKTSRLISGASLPMLLRAMTYRHEPLDTLVMRAMAGGTQGVMQVAVTAPQNQSKRPHDPSHNDHQQ